MTSSFHDHHLIHVGFGVILEYSFGLPQRVLATPLQFRLVT